MTDTLVIKHQTIDEAVEGFGEQMESDEDLPHVVAFADADELSKLLTERRMETIEVIMTEEPDSIRELARILDRGLREVHDDVHTLEEYGVVELRDEGRYKKPVVPYDDIDISVRLSREGAVGPG
jgi:predicted transcriptional regulator